ncbi:50S ribosomal protein L9, partial [Bacillus sp. S34]|nr:50S ribosomal protein L9 [Bacillus sp. S34]
IEEAQDLKMKLENATIQLSVKAGKDGRLFGSVRPGDVADAVQAQGVGSLDKRKVEVPATIKTIGDHEATVRLREDITAVISLKVVAAK